MLCLGPIIWEIKWPSAINMTLLDTYDVILSENKIWDHDFFIFWLLSASKNPIFAKNGWFFGFPYVRKNSSYTINKTIIWIRTIDFLFKILISNIFHQKFLNQPVFCKYGWFLGFPYGRKNSPYKISKTIIWIRTINFLFKILISNIFHQKSLNQPAFLRKWLDF